MMDDTLRRHLGRHPLGAAAEILPDAAGLRPEQQNVVYPIPGGAWAHIWQEGPGKAYALVEPGAEASLEETERLRELVARHAAGQGDRPRQGSLRQALEGILPKLGAATDPALHQRVVRDMAGFGPIDALLRDPHLEDIHVVGTNPVHVIHGMHGMLATNVRFTQSFELTRFIRLLCERLGRPVSDATPIVDAVLPDGSRLNLVYSEDVSRRGASLSLRRATESPLSITRLVQLNTLSAEAAAYLWMCLEHGMSLFICGEAACGKTTTLNAMLPFIDPRSKVYTAEDTPEVHPPQRIWQRLLTRESGARESQVQMFDLLRAALRSRPDYIIVGEIRGAEGAVAFQAMQTGHPTLATFHATDPTSLVQRLGAAPMSIPMSFMDNLNVAVFQEARIVGGRRVRRITRIVEFAGSSAEGVETIPVFELDRARDELKFQGLNNSHILEGKIAPLLGMDDTRRIYDTFNHRAGLVAGLAARGVTEASAVARVFMQHRLRGDIAFSEAA